MFAAVQAGIIDILNLLRSNISCDDISFNQFTNFNVFAATLYTRVYYCYVVKV